MYVFFCVCVFCGSGEEGLKVMIWIEESLEKFSHTHKRAADDERLATAFFIISSSMYVTSKKLPHNLSNHKN